MTGGLFYPKDTLINMFKTVCDAHRNKASYVTVGKSYENRDITLFRIGTPNGGKVLLDSSMHGWEDIGSVVQYHYAKWLLETSDSYAQKTLRENYTLLIPIVNMDSRERQNQDFSSCSYGVDLNRNFVRSWNPKACNDYDYPGLEAGSEPETKALKYVFNTYRPSVYLNMHYGGGPYLAYHNKNNMVTVNAIISRIDQLSPQLGVTPYSVESQGAGGAGFAVNDANESGATAWLLECASPSAPLPTSGDTYTHTAHTLNDIQNYFWPKMKPVFIAFSESCGVPSPPTPYLMLLPFAILFSILGLIWYRER